MRSPSIGVLEEGGVEIKMWGVFERERERPPHSGAWGPPQFQENALGVKRPFAELSESSGVFLEQLSEFEIPFSEYKIPFSEWHPKT